MLALAIRLFLLASTQVHSKLPDIANVTAFSIATDRIDDWLSWKCHHFFTKEDSVWRCSTSISVDGLLDTVVYEDEVASNVVSAFLARLSRTDPKKKRYNPEWTHSEMLIRESICFKWDNDSMAYDSWSQGVSGGQWLVTFRADTLMTKPRAVNESLELLKPFFHEGTLDSVVKFATLQNLGVGATGAGKPVKYISACEIDLNADGERDSALLLESDKGIALIALLKTTNGFRLYLISGTVSVNTFLRCNFGSRLLEQVGVDEFLVVNAPGAYLELYQPEGASVGYYWSGQEFKKISLSD